ncbi:MAG: RNA 2'-phosphotransferase [Pseudomonadota bacterium]
MSKRKEIKVHELSRLMIYILGHRPYEFGLVPDAEGFITYKELLWALHEEPGWGHVRQGHLHEVLLSKDRDLFQADDNRMRTLERIWVLDLENPSHSLPKILFIAVRRKAHAHVMEKGLPSWADRYFVLSSERDMAMRIGRRRDQKPVLLEIMASAAQKENISFYPFGTLFLTREIPCKFITGPPLSKEVPKTPVADADKKDKMRPVLEAGTFFLDIKRDSDPLRRLKGKKPKGWKEEARKLRKRKRD